MFQLHYAKAVEIPQPVDLSSRVRVATSFAERYGLNEIRLLVDTPENYPHTTAEDSKIILGNSFERNFAAWPLRFYVIVDNIIVSLCDCSGCNVV